MRALALSVFLAVAASAHEGPPFAIFVERAVGPFSVDLWGDPDVGTGTFFVLVNAPAGAAVPTVSLEVKPVSGRLPPKTFETTREPARQGLRFVGRPAFDVEERWTVRVVVTGPAGAADASAEVDVTPPDLGRAGLWLYALPFLGVGGLWAKALLSRRR